MAFKKADVFIPAPSWVSYAPQAKLVGHHIIKLNTTFEERWRINSKTIAEGAKLKKHETSILILNYPGNPDGLTYSKQELIDIAGITKSQNMLVISDEIYGLLNHNRAHLSFSNYYPEKTITTYRTIKMVRCGRLAFWRRISI